MNVSRKNFLKAVGVGSVAMLAPNAGFSSEGNRTAADSTSLKIGLASYTLRKLKLDDTITATKRLGFESIALKSMHLPLESTLEEIKAAAEKVRAAGLNLYGAGVIYMKTAREVEIAFSYASEAGLDTIIGGPNHVLLPAAEAAVKKYNIRLAIHNHGPGDQLYRSVNDVYEKIKGLDKRVGMCIDVGHVVRIKEDPIAMITKYKDRLYDMHMKDVNKAEEDGTPVEMGRGVIDIPGIVKALKKIKYGYQVAIEYEKDGDDPIPGLAESVGYLRGVIKTS